MTKHLPSVTIVRRIKASPARIFRAITEPSQMLQWWGPDAGPTLSAEADVRPGGRFSVVFRLMNGDEHNPTGVYREPWLPPWVREAEEAALREWMIGELSGEIEGSGVQAGWIKIGATDEGLTEAETKVLRAAASASVATGAAVGSHTIRGRVARAQIDLFERSGGDPGPIPEPFRLRFRHGSRVYATLRPGRPESIFSSRCPWDQPFKAGSRAARSRCRAEPYPPPPAARRVSLRRSRRSSSASPAAAG